MLISAPRCSQHYTRRGGTRAQPSTLRRLQEAGFGRQGQGSYAVVERLIVLPLQGI